MQRFINYRFKFAIYGDYSRCTSRPLKDFIRESNEGRDFSFVAPGRRPCGIWPTRRSGNQGGTSMEIRILAPGDALWSRASDYAAACPWPGGAELAKRMRANAFADRERVFLALDGESPAGFCALVSGDCPGGAPESPFIAGLFVDRAHRGRRLSKDLIDAAEDFARNAGFSQVCLASDLVGIFEKYGFSSAGETKSGETLFVHALPAPENAKAVSPIRSMLPLMAGLLALIGAWMVVGRSIYPG